MGTPCIPSYHGQPGIGITSAVHLLCWALLLWYWSCGRKNLGENVSSQPSWWQHQGNSEQQPPWPIPLTKMLHVPSGGLGSDNGQPHLSSCPPPAPQMLKPPYCSR